MMRRPVWLFLGVLACGGGGDDTGTTVSSGGDDDDNGGGGDVVIDCSSRPIYDLPSLTCEQIANAFIETTQWANPCNVDADCQMVHPNCVDWADVGCYYVVNKCVDSSLVADFSSNAAGCITNTGQVGICECGGAPAAYCVDHHCCSPGSADSKTYCVAPE